MGWIASPRREGILQREMIRVEEAGRLLLVNLDHGPGVTWRRSSNVQPASTKVSSELPTDDPQRRDIVRIMR